MNGSHPHCHTCRSLNQDISGSRSGSFSVNTWSSVCKRIGLRRRAEQRENIDSSDEPGQMKATVGLADMRSPPTPHQPPLPNPQLILQLVPRQENQ